MRRYTGHIVTALATAAVAGGSALAQQEWEQERPKDRTQDRQQERDRVHQPDRTPMRDKQMTQMMMMIHHADDDVINAPVTNLRQEDLGKIGALVVNMETGHVAYAIVSFGGFLGIGDELHAVPWNAFTMRPLYEGLVLDVTREQLERHEGFSRNELPRWDDQTWAQRLHQEFGTRPYWEERRMDSPRMREGRPMSFEQDRPQRERPQQPRRPRDRDDRTYPGMAQYITTYDLVGMTVENPRGEKIGTIRDFAFNLQTGEVEYMILGYGGWLGIAETHTAMPLDAFQPHVMDTDDPRMILDVTQEQMRAAPEYSIGEWPRHGAADWFQDLGREPRRPLTEPGREPTHPMR